jgi:hypothetical protein
MSWGVEEPNNITRELDAQAKRLSVLWDCSIRCPGGKHEFECWHGLIVMQFMVKSRSDTELIALHEKFVKLVEGGMSQFEALNECGR